VDELSSVNSESFLVGLVSDTVFHFGSEHHLVASHKVEHDVFQSRLERLWINQIEIDLVVSCHLDTFVSFDEVNETSDIKLVVLLPEFVHFCWIIFVLFLNNFEKHDLT